MIDESIAAGAKVVRGGKPGGGLFYPPTLLTGITLDMPVAKEEIFGPVAAILKFREEEEVVRLANGTAMGLAGRACDLDWKWCYLYFTLFIYLFLLCVCVCVLYIKWCVLRER